MFAFRTSSLYCVPSHWQEWAALICSGSSGSITVQCNYFAVELAAWWLGDQLSRAAAVAAIFRRRLVWTIRWRSRPVRVPRGSGTDTGLRPDQSQMRPTGRPSGVESMRGRGWSGRAPRVTAADAARRTDNGPRVRWKALASTRFSSSDATNCDRRPPPTTDADWPASVAHGTDAAAATDTRRAASMTGRSQPHSRCRLRLYLLYGCPFWPAQCRFDRIR